ncbi:MAG: hypothetical protein HQL53_12245, partial [Magnetococcales bacterium]|nr:hypothetical protein [Magnetococcales bacterium]
IANILEAALEFPDIQLSLQHKQSSDNFSKHFFSRGGVGRLIRTLGQRGHQIAIHGTTPALGVKRLPTNPDTSGPLLREAIFSLAAKPQRPFQLFSSTIDPFGRAELLDPSEYVHEVNPPPTSSSEVDPNGFDTDPMFWLDGRITPFAAAHLTYGTIQGDGLEVVLSRMHKDPLLSALARQDPRLLEIAREWNPKRVNNLVRKGIRMGPLLVCLLEAAELRLYLTEKLLEITP